MSAEGAPAARYPGGELELFERAVRWKAYLGQHWGDDGWANVRSPFEPASAEDLALASERLAAADFALAA